MRIIHFSDSFYPLVNGVVTDVLNTISFQVSQGHEVMIVAPKPANKDIDERFMEEMLGRGVRVVFRPSIPILVYPKYRLGSPSPVLMGQAKRFKPDVVHLHSILTLGLEAIRTAKMLKCPLVGTFHTYFMEPESMRAIGLKAQNMVSGFLSKILWSFAYKFYGKCDLVVCPTNFVARDLRKRWKGVKTRVVPGGVEVLAFSDLSNKLRLRKKYGLNKKFVFLWLGRLSYEKSLEVLIEAFFRIADEERDACLVFVGDGPARKSLEFYSQELNLKEKVLFLGEIKHNKVVRDNYYALGDVFVTASTFETQGLTINEAMAAGLPVLGVRARAMPELIGGGGLISRPDDSLGMARNMRKIIKDGGLRNKLSKKSQEKVVNFSVESSVNRLMGVYEEVVKLQK